MRAAVLAVVVVVVGCGDNRAGAPDAEMSDECLSRPPFPADGELSDPTAIPLPDDCVEGGVAGVIGRWFVASADYTDIVSYPGYEQACGRTRERGAPEWDHTDPDRQRDTWSDDTRVVVRESFFQRPRATLACARGDGTIAVVGAVETPDGEIVTNEHTGVPFGWRDELASGLTLVGALPERADGTAIDAYNLVVDGGHAYVVGPGGFDVVDVGDPAQPRPVGHVDCYCNDVRVVHGGGRTIAFVADDTTRSIDVTDPTAPTPIASLGLWSHSLQLAVGSGTRLFIADGLNPVVLVYDVTDPLVPHQVGTVSVDGGIDADVHDLSVAGSVLYANATYGGTVAFDTSSGYDSAVEIGRFTTDPPMYSHASWPGVAGGREIVLDGDEFGLGTTDGMAFLRVLDGDRTAPGYMTQIGRYQSRREVSLHYFVLAGDRAYVAYYQDGVRVVDLADPTAPVEVAHYNTWIDERAKAQLLTGAFSLRVVGDLIYVADSTAGLIILRDPAVTRSASATQP